MKAHDESVVFGSEDPNWCTPRALFDPLNAEFGFVTDVCASAASHLCGNWFGPDHEQPYLRDGLSVGWRGYSPCFMNPPYSRELKLPIDPWVEKARAEAERGATVVGLVPFRPDVAWWRKNVVHAVEIRIIPHRVKFARPPGWIPKPRPKCINCTPAAACLKHTKSHGAGFPTAVVVWRPQPGIVGPAPPRWVTWDYRQPKAPKQP